jgi:hypothetical protein
MKKYNVETNIYGQEVIWYEEDGFRYSFIADEKNPDYQAYLEYIAENPVEDVE